MLNRGRLVILVIFALAAGLGGYAWWHHYRQGRHSLKFWGSQSAVMIRYAPRVELLLLADEASRRSDVERLPIAGNAAWVAERFDISRVRGLVHARHALVEDASFLWNNPHRGREPKWEFALRFADGDKQATVAFDVACGRVRLLPGEREASLTPAVMRAFQQKAEDWRQLPVMTAN